MSGLPNCVARVLGSSARIGRDAESGPETVSTGSPGPPSPYPAKPDGGMKP
jgi:hypothetical protein